MGFALLTCPHCGAERMTFASVVDVVRRESKGVQLFATLVCAGCGDAVLAQYGRTNEAASRGWGTMNVSGNVEPHGFALMEMWPKPRSNAAPKHTPPSVAKIFAQAANALNRGDWDAAGAMARKVVDVGTRELDTDPNFGKLTLKQRVESLASRHVITPQLQEWAHAVRIDGNEAVHEPDFTKEEAEQIFGFTEILLEYVFMMPGMLKERRNPPAPPAPP